MQLATYCGWRLRGVPGGLLAGGLFVVPGALIIFALAALYAAYGDLAAVQALFLGVQATVVVVVIEALLRVARRALKAPDRWAVAGLAFLGIYAFGLPFPLIVLAAGLYGLATARGEAPARARRRGPRRHRAHRGPPGSPWWLLPLAALRAAGAERLYEIGRFFAGLAVVTFGGAYAVLAWMTQAAVETEGWLTTEQMIDALGLAETTPGPLILVTQVRGFPGRAARRLGHGFRGRARDAARDLRAVLPVDLRRPPPYLDWIASRPRLTGALSAITAAVVGVIANLSLWFGLHVLFADVGALTAGPLDAAVPDPATLDPRALALTALAAGAAARAAPAAARRAGALRAGGARRGGALTPPFRARAGCPNLGERDEETRHVPPTRLRDPHAQGDARPDPRGSPGGGRPRPARKPPLLHHLRHAAPRRGDRPTGSRTATPEEMTIVMQNWFENLEVSEEGFSVTLNFGDAPEPLYIPFDALRTFVDPSVEFGLRFEPTEAERGDAGAPAARPMPERRAAPQPREDDAERGDAEVRLPRQVPQVAAALPARTARR